MKRRYRHLARQYHPDRNPTQDGRKFAEMHEEYERIKSGSCPQLYQPPKAEPTETDPLKGWLVAQAFAIQRQPFPRSATVWVIGWRVWVRGIATGDTVTRQRMEREGYVWDELREGFWREAEGERREYSGVEWGELFGMYQTGVYRGARV